MRFFSRRIHKAFSKRDTVEISERNGVRYLHLGNDTVQSAMRIKAPNDLELTYTQAMLGFLPWLTAPAKNALLIGLGGGSLAKFLYHQFPDMALCAVDIHAEVIQVAYTHFLLPRDERLCVVEADAAQYIQRQRNRDIILLDGFDSKCQVPELASETFYRECAEALAPHGVLSVNLWRSDPLFAEYCTRLSHAFEHPIMTLPAEHKGNTIAIAFREPPSINDRQIKLNAIALEIRHRLPFTRFVANVSKG